MPGVIVKLSHEWTVGDQIGEPSGMGTVFEAACPAYPRAAIKYIPKIPGAERELLLAGDLADVSNVVPLLDSGEFEDSLLIVMPRADKSLRQHLRDNHEQLDVEACVHILMDIASALKSIEGRVVHRDLKPENILFLDGKWCLTDFGISRYATASTDANTRKYWMTDQYAAPEQWRHERASETSDIYALGIIAYELLAGTLPFSGPDYRDQHLHMSPPELVNVPAGIAALIYECLAKSPGARPSATVFYERLPRAAAPAPAGGLAELAEANRIVAVLREEESRAQSVARTASEERAELASAAHESLARMMGLLKETIFNAAPNSDERTQGPDGWLLSLNNGRLSFYVNAVSDASSTPRFNVISTAVLEVSMPTSRHGYNGRSHSLWYCDAQVEGQYGWFETAFMRSPLLREFSSTDPYSLDPRAARDALFPMVGSIQVAWPFTPLTFDNLDDFIRRWAGWFAAASLGTLQHPSSMPERQPHGSWR